MEFVLYTTYANIPPSKKVGKIFIKLKCIRENNREEIKTAAKTLVLFIKDENINPLKKSSSKIAGTTAIMIICCPIVV
jgi:signal recognition particle subunit SEC65